MTISIGIIVVGYKDKNLSGMVRALKEATVSENTVYVVDQHPIKHEKEFEDIENCVYEYLMWDQMDGPAQKRSEKVTENGKNHTHICILSPDVTMSSGWDLELVDILNSKNVVFSGSGTVSVKQKDLFSISASYDPCSEFSTTQMIDRNFIFAKSEAFNKIVMPHFLKYSGENEYLSISFLSAGFDIMSVPSRFYSDSLTRSVENTYHTFSLEHGYNRVVDLFWGQNISKYKCNKNGLDKFLKFHGLELRQIKKLPYINDDVSYEPYGLKMNDLDARRFLAGTKAVY